MYQEYLKVINNALETKEKVEFNKELLSEVNGNEITFTLKNYHSVTGLSQRIHNATAEELFEIKGPLGKGLDLTQDGTYVAFAAGTGILVFIDLIAHLIRKNLGLLNKEEESLLSENFKFIFYFSYHR